MAVRTVSLLGMKSLASTSTWLFSVWCGHVFTILLLAAGYSRAEDGVRIGVGKSFINSDVTIGELGVEYNDWELTATQFGQGWTKRGEQEAEEPEVKWFTHTTLFAGVDYDPSSTFCVKGTGDDNLTSNFGLRQNLLKRGDVSVTTTYTHHSCALNEDKPTYDAIGISVEWTFWR